MKDVPHFEISVRYKKGKLTGTLSLHGVSRPISLDVTHLTPDANADKQVFSATGTLKRSA